MITIYGKTDCDNCVIVKAELDAEYKPHAAIWDDYGTDDASAIVTSSGGNLPIVVIETPAGRVVLSPTAASKLACEGGACTIGGKK